MVSVSMKLERHGGKITAESRSEEGAVFIVILPEKQSNEARG